MALSTYTELLAAVRTELGVSTSGLADAVIVDAVTRAEAKINRRARFRDRERISEADYAVGTNAIEQRRIALPDDLLELISLKAKVATADDTDYRVLQYIHPSSIDSKYTDSELYYTVRNQIEFSRSVTSAHKIMIHYLYKLDIASESTNWLLTRYPDVYLYGALAECEMHLLNDARIPMWKAYFDSGIAEVNEVDERNRDDSIMDISEVTSLHRHSTFDIFTG